MAELREDQKQIAERIIELLKSHPIVGLQAPTGWGKSYVASYVVKTLGGKWIWASSLLAALAQSSKALSSFNIRYFMSTGKERLCNMGYRHADFVIRNPCLGCRFQANAQLRGFVDLFVDYTQIKEFAEENGICGYYTQEKYIRMLLTNYNDIVILMNYARIGKFARYVGNFIFDEVHNLYLPKITQVPRKAIEQLLDKLGVKGIDARNAELIRAVLNEQLLQLLTIAAEETNELISLDDVVSFIESHFTYYDPDEDMLTGIRIEGLPSDLRGRMVLMSATLPPSMSSIPTVKVPPSSTVVMKVPKWSRAMTSEYVAQHDTELSKKLGELLSDGTPTVIYTTSSKEISLDNVVYEDEMSQGDICRRNLMLRYFGRYSEGIRLGCYRRMVLITIPLLPTTTLKRLSAKGISEVDLVTMKLTQVIGRLLPQNDGGHPEVIMLDKRIWKYCDLLMNYGIECVEVE